MAFTYPLVQTGTPPSCYGTPSDLFALIAQSFGVSLSIMGVIISQDEPSPDQRGMLLVHLNPNGSQEGIYTYWTTGPSGPGWYKEDPYFVGQVSIFEAGPPSTRWVICDGTNGTYNYASRLIGASGSTGVGLTTRTAGQILGEETHVLTNAEVPQTPIANAGGALVSGAGGGPNNTITAPSSPGADLTAVIRVNGGGGAHNNMPPSIFVPWYKFVGPQAVILGS